MRKNEFLSILVFMFLALIFSSCAQRPPVMPPHPVERVHRVPEPPIIRQDVYHEVAPGETIWRISKTYDVTADSILEANSIRDASRIEAGQVLLIPRACPRKTVIPLFNTTRWEYIVIHHSATSFGNSFFFDKVHNVRGFNRGIGYNFVINNGTRNKKDGEIEVTPRWIKQIDGAHCKAFGMNRKGIGVVLVGDFTYESPTEAQLDSLIRLVNILRQYYDIPIENIMGHGQVPGAATECPGRMFPWNYFLTRLEQNTFKNVRENDGTLKVIFVKDNPVN